MKTIALFAAFLSTQAFAVPGYPLVCRGNTNGFSYDALHDVIRMSFNRGTGPSSNGVPRGTCTWIDRGMTSSEPNRICQYDVERMTFQWLGPNTITSVQSDQASWLAAARDPARTFVVQVYNDGYGCMHITRVGP